MTPTYEMVTTRGTRYTLAENGAVLARTDGPQGWDYGGRWVILGAAKRHHSRHALPLDYIARNGVPGHGIVRDLDHGTLRVWGNERMRSLRRIVP